jgi:hypothetical protein
MPPLRASHTLPLASVNAKIFQQAKFVDELHLVQQLEHNLAEKPASFADAASAKAAAIAMTNRPARDSPA